MLCINPQNTREFHFCVSLSSLCSLSLSLWLRFFALALQSPNSYPTRTVRLSGQLSIASISHSYCVYSSSLFFLFLFSEICLLRFCLCYFCTVRLADLSPQLTLLCTKSRVFFFGYSVRVSRIYIFLLNFEFYLVVFV